MSPTHRSAEPGTEPGTQRERAPAGAERGLRRRIIASVPTTAAALGIVARTDANTAVPEQVCRGLLAAFDLRIRPVPVALPELEMVPAWHRHYDTDPAHTWLRQTVRDIVAGLAAD